MVLPLHSSLAIEEQDRVFDTPPEGVRKLIVSTNIAETSVTIDGIRFVIDSGLQKEMVYDASSGVRSLMTGWISRASAEQRKGRAGRTGPGHCYRLYSEHDFHTHFLPFSSPEVTRMNLDSTLLQITAAGMDPRDFPFIDPPSEESMASALLSLDQHGAVVDSTAGASSSSSPVTATGRGAETPRAALRGKLCCTVLGRALSLLPVDLSAGKILLLSTVFETAVPAASSLLTIAAALSVQSPLQRQREGISAAADRAAGDTDVARRRDSFLSPHGEPFTLLNCFDDWMHAKKQKGKQGGRGGGRATHAWCRRHGVQENRLYEMSKLRQQFDDMLRGLRGGRESLINLPAGAVCLVGRLVLARLLGCGADKICCATTAALSEGRRQGQHSSVGGADAMRAVERRATGRAAGHQRPPTADSQSSRHELRHLQQSAERARRRRVLRLDDEGGVAEMDDDEEGAHLSIDVRHMSFQLSYRLDAPAQKGRDLSRADLNLLKLILAAAFYPNLAIPDEHNAGVRKASDVCFHTKLKKFVQLHPTSTAAHDPAAACGPLELLCFSQLLETSAPFLVHPMAVPALHVLLLFASTVDTDLACTRLVVDSWLTLRVKSGHAGEKLLLIAHQLRLLWASLLHRSLVDGPLKTAAMDAGATAPADANPVVARVPKLGKKDLAQLPRFAQQIYAMRELTTAGVAGIAEPAVLLAEKVSAFLACPVEYTVERTKLSELASELGIRAARDRPGRSDSGARVGNQQHAGQSSKSNPMDELSIEAQLHTHGADAAPPNKSGWRLASWLHYGSLLPTTGSGTAGNGGAAVENDLTDGAPQRTVLAEMRSFLGLSEHEKKPWRCPRCNLKLNVTLPQAKGHDIDCAAVAAERQVEAAAAAKWEAARVAEQERAAEAAARRARLDAAELTRRTATATTQEQLRLPDQAQGVTDDRCPETRGAGEGVHPRLAGDGDLSAQPTAKQLAGSFLASLKQSASMPTRPTTASSVGPSQSNSATTLLPGGLVIDWSTFHSGAELAAATAPELLKQACQRRGLKAGGTVMRTLPCGEGATN